MDDLARLDPQVIELLRCPLCKGCLAAESDRFLCGTCRSAYPLVRAARASVFDFRIQRPGYVIPDSIRSWQDNQTAYEAFDARFSERDALQEYLDEIDSVREIYTAEFHIEGAVLDVGGHQGRLRHYLADDVPLYVSVDPFIDVFRHAGRPNLLAAYPCLAAPCNFLSCHAESLPFAAASFDWVHMRSVVDHFADPYLALKEAYRVLKPGGRLLVGVSIAARAAELPAESVLRRLRGKLRKEGALRAAGAVARRIGRRVRPERDHHNWRPTHAELVALLSTTGFAVVKEHWQKPPFSFVMYVCGSKVQAD